MKKLSEILMLLVLIFSVVACGGGSDSAGDTKPETPATTVQPDTDTPTIPDTEPEPDTQEPKNTAPTISDLSNIILMEGASQQFNISVSDIDGDDITVGVTSSNSILTVDESNGVITLSSSNSIEKDTEVSVTITASDGVDTSSKSIKVTIENSSINLGNNSPEISLKDQIGDYSIIYSNEITTIKVIVSDQDITDTTSWSVVSLIAMDNDVDAAINYIETYEKVDDEFVIKTKVIPEGVVVNYTLTLSVTDAKETVQKDFTLSAVNRINAFPITKFSGTYQNQVPAVIGQPVVINYGWVDDDAEAIIVNDLSHWYGDETNNTYTLDTETKSITITSNGAEGDAFGLLLNFTDKNFTGSSGVLITTIQDRTSVQNDILAYTQTMFNKMNGLKEYQRVARFYADVVSNLGIATEAEAERLARLAQITDNYDYVIAKNILGTFEYNAVFSTDDSRDEDLVNTYMLTIESRLEEAIKNYGKTSLSYVNQLADLSNGLLPTLVFEEGLNQYDSTNNLWSRFAGNLNYGEYVGDNFVFSEKYSFMNAIISETKRTTSTLADR